MAITCQRCGGQMVADSITAAASKMPWLLISAGIGGGAALIYWGNVALGIVLGLPLTLGGLLLTFRGPRSVWRCTSCDKSIDR